MELTKDEIELEAELLADSMPFAKVVTGADGSMLSIGGSVYQVNGPLSSNGADAVVFAKALRKLANGEVTLSGEGNAGALS